MKGKPLVNVQIRAEQEVSELFENTMQAHEFPTRGKFLEYLLERFLNPKTESVIVARPEDAARIAELESVLTENLQEITDLKHKLFISPPPADGLIIPFTATDLHFINEMKRPHEIRSKSEVTSEHFVQSMIKGLYMYGKIYSQKVFTAKEIRDQERASQPNE
jgi:hypothetical protein